MDFYTQQQQLDRFMSERSGFYRPDAEPFPDESDEQEKTRGELSEDTKRYDRRDSAAFHDLQPRTEQSDGFSASGAALHGDSSPHGENNNDSGCDGADPIRFTAQEIIIPKEKHRHVGAWLMILAALGAAAGFLLYEKLFDALSYDTVYSYLNLRIHGGFFSNAASSFFGALIWLLIPFAAGLCAVGQPIAAAVMPIKGIGIGIVGAYFLSTYGMNGLWAFAALVLPSALIGTAITAYQCKCALKCSCRLLRYITGKSTDPHPTRFYSSYISSSVLCVICCFLLGIIDAGVSAIFGGFFVI